MTNEILKKIAQKVVKSRTRGTGMNQTTTSVVAINRPEGLRYYQGKGMGGGSFAKTKALTSALWKSKNTPGDSVTTNYMKAFKGDK